VLRDGIKVETKAASQWDESSLVRAMVGRELASLFSSSHSYAPGEAVLEVKGLTRLPHFEDVTFKVYKGEVLGIYGLVGAGRTDLAESIFGLTASDSGVLYIDGSPVQIRSPRDAIADGIALVPEDRRTLGLISSLDVRKNLSLPILRLLSSWGFVKQKEELELAKESIQTLEIRVPAIKALVSTLSGGNQQKVVLGKWLNTDPEILILDDPTKGIDVGAKAEIRRIVDNLAGEGKAVILISSELPEILGMSDRVLVMREGRIVGEYDRDMCSDEILGALAAGISIGNLNGLNGRQE
jgi:ABC-type sugar transport system ATPase subunit